jgi:hypothetical protein
MAPCHSDRFSHNHEAHRAAQATTFDPITHLFILCIVTGSRLSGCRFNRQTGSLPFRKPLAKPSGYEAACAKFGHGFE